MKDSTIFLNIAKDEIETLLTYSNFLSDSSEEQDTSIRATIEEIMSDELNHALIALLSASQVLGIKIATDDITPNPNTITVS